MIYVSQGKMHGLFPSSNSFGTPSSTTSGTPSGIASDTPSYTKTVGKLAVVILAAYDGKIGDMGFSHARGLQLLIS
jgi:hypothetical protein